MLNDFNNQYSEGGQMIINMQSTESLEGYQIMGVLGSGSFGKIYEAKWNDKRVALKVQSLDNLKPMLQLQFQVMTTLKGQQGFPQVYEYRNLQTQNIMSMQLLNKSLQDLFKQYNNSFDIRTALQIMWQVLHRLQSLHEKGFLYRDVKPSNFMLGEDKRTIYIIDFGLCKRYSKLNSGNHIPQRHNKKLVGTPLFCSIFTHNGQQQSRRDDLESLLYMALYFIRHLPWENIKQQNKQRKYEKIKQVKQSISQQQLCQGLPKQLITYLKYCKSLQFEDKPDYCYLKSLLRQAIKQVSSQHCSEFVWLQPPVSQVKPKISFSFKPPISKSPPSLNIEELKNGGNLFENIVCQKKNIQ